MNFTPKVICDEVKALSLFCDQHIYAKCNLILLDPEHALFKCLLHGCQFRSLAHKKPTEEETTLILLQFNSSTGHDQTSEPVNHSVWFY